MTTTFGLTGGIGSGKSVCSRYLASKGFTIVDADALTAEAYTCAHVVLKRTFGPAVFDPSNRIDRKKLASLVFSDPSALTELNAILHPVMSELAQNKLAQAQDAAVLDAALLFEAGWDKLVETTVVVITPLDLRLERIMTRDNTTRDRALARIRAQLSDDDRLRRADHTIYNVGTLNLLYAQCDHVFCNTRL